VGHGSNIFGQLGDGTTTNRNTWEQVATSVASVAAGGAGGNHTLFVRPTVLCGRWVKIKTVNWATAPRSTEASRNKRLARPTSPRHSRPTD